MKRSRTRRARRSRGPTSAGALAWLAAFANVGFDDGQPRPPVLMMGRSRFLGLHARERDYKLDEKRPHDVVPHPFGHAIITPPLTPIVLEWTVPEAK